MATVSSVCCHGPSLCEWCLHFGTALGRISKAERNTRVGIGEDVNKTDGHIHFFMRNNEDPVSCCSRVTVVDEFCDGVNLAVLEERENNNSLCPVALISEGLDNSRAAVHRLPQQSIFNAVSLFNHYSDAQVR